MDRRDSIKTLLGAAAAAAAPLLGEQAVPKINPHRGSSFDEWFFTVQNEDGKMEMLRYSINPDWSITIRK